jgi:hypothetical protein
MVACLDRGAIGVGKCLLLSSGKHSAMSAGALRAVLGFCTRRSVHASAAAGFADLQVYKCVTSVASGTVGFSVSEAFEAVVCSHPSRLQDAHIRTPIRPSGGEEGKERQTFMHMLSMLRLAYVTMTSRRSCLVTTFSQHTHFNPSQLPCIRAIAERSVDLCA